jgi:Protein of unknown function, DUF624
MTGILGTRIMAALAALFNFLALNLVLLIASLPVITLPAAISAATQALERWRRDEEDHVVREFLDAFRAGWARQTVLVGVPLAAAVLGVIEVRHFAAGPGAANAVSRLALGFGTVALLVTASALGYVLLLATRGRADLEGSEDSGDAAGLTGSTAAEFWTECVRLGIRNLFVTGPLFLVEIGGAAALGWIDPPLLLLGLPLLALQLMRLTANLGLRRAGRPVG